MDRIMQRFESERAAGASAIEAAGKVQVPLPTIYRWRNKWIYKKETRPSLSLPDSDVGKAIIILCKTCENVNFRALDKTTLVRIEALFAFLTWVRWPKDPEAQRLGTITCIFTYLFQRHGAKRVGELNKATANFLSDILRLDYLSCMCSEQMLHFPFFGEFPLVENKPHDENDCLADIARYVIAHGRNVDDPRKSASIGKAIFLANQNGFKYEWSMASFSLRKLLRERGGAAPFCYAQHQSALDWPWNPGTSDFTSNLENTLNNADALRDFFSKARWAVEQFQTILDPKALQSLALPRFPAELRATSFKVEPLTDRMMTILQRYQSGSKSLNWLADEVG